MKTKIAKLKNHLKSDFAKNFLILFTGTGFSQIIPILVAPFLTRLFTPEEFGLLALFTTTAMFMGNFATLKYDSAIMLPKREKDALNIMALSIIIVSIFSLFLIIIIVVFNNSLADLMGNEKMRTWLYFVPISTFFSGLFRTLNIWTSRKKQFKRLAMRNIMQSTTTAGTKLGLGFLSKVNGGLIIGSLTGQITSTLVLLFQTLRKEPINFSTISTKRILLNVKKYREFPMYANTLGFFSMFKETGVRYIISNFYGTAILGSYSFTMTMLQKPSQIIGSSISQVYYQKATEAFNKGNDLWLLTKKIMFILMFFSFIIYIPILFFGQEIFSFVFGEKWIKAGTFAQIMTPWLMSRFIVQFSTIIPQIMEKQKTFFFINTFFNLSIFIIVLIVSFAGIDFNHTLLLMTIIMCFMLIIWLFWFKKITRHGMK